MRFCLLGVLLFCVSGCYWHAGIGMSSSTKSDPIDDGTDEENSSDQTTDADDLDDESCPMAQRDGSWQGRQRNSLGSGGMFRSLIWPEDLPQVLGSRTPGLRHENLIDMEGETYNLAKRITVDIVMQETHRRLTVRNPANARLCGDQLVVENRSGDIYSGPMGEVSHVEILNRTAGRVTLIVFSVLLSIGTTAGLSVALAATMF